MNEKENSDTSETTELNSWQNPYKAFLNAYPGSLFDEKLHSKQIDDYLLLNRDSQLYLEIGAGSGKHLLELALRCPDAQFLGIEKRYKRAVRCIQKAETLKINNLTMLRGNFFTLQKHLKNVRLAGIFCNFPDPWDKSRWKKHRMLSNEGLSELEDLLHPGGFLSFKTDHRELFQDTLILLEERNWYQEVISSDWSLDSQTLRFENIQTEFEGLFLSQQKNVFFTLQAFGKKGRIFSHPYNQNS